MTNLFTLILSTVFVCAVESNAADGTVAGECGKREMGIGLSGYTLHWPGGRSLISSTVCSDPEIQGRETAIAHTRRVGAGRAQTCDLPAEARAIIAVGRLTIKPSCGGAVHETT